MKLNSNITILVLLSLGICLFPIFLSSNYNKEYITLLFLIQYLIFFSTIFFLQNRTSFLISPTFLIITYISLNFILGSWAFNNNLVLKDEYLINYNNWKNLNLNIVLFFSG